MLDSWKKYGRKEMRDRGGIEGKDFDVDQKGTNEISSD